MKPGRLMHWLYKAKLITKPIDFNELHDRSRKRFNGFGFEIKQILARVMDPVLDIAIQYYDNLVFGFDQATFAYCQAEAAHDMANEFEPYFPSHAGYLRYKIRNYHFENFFQRWHSLLDYSAIFINELYPEKERPVPFKTKGETVSPGIRHVDYEKTVESLEKFMHKTTKYSALERQKQLEGLKAFYKGIPEQVKANLNLLRNIILHRYIPGFDHMSMSVQRDLSNIRLKPNYGRYMMLGGGVTYYMVPEFTYKELQDLAEVLVRRANDAILIFADLDVIKTARQKAQDQAGKSVPWGNWFEP